MSTITCRFLGSLRQVAGDRGEETIEMEGQPTVSDLLSELAKRHGRAFAKRMFVEGGQPSPGVLVSISGQSEFVGRCLERVLHDGDEVIFLSALAGGTNMPKTLDDVIDHT